jgi:ankyrin repeat protein/truncated hemoglobin YjbI
VAGQAIRVDPQSAAAYNNRAVSYNSKKNYDRGIADATMAVRLDPRFSPAYNNRGWALVEKGELARGVQDCNEAIRINPKNKWPYRKRGHAYYRSRQYDYAIESYTGAIKLDPDDAILYQWRGNCSRRKATPPGPRPTTPSTAGCWVASSAPPVFPGALTPSQPPAWKEFASPEGGFKVLIPDRPALASEPAGLREPDSSEGAHTGRGVAAGYRLRVRAMPISIHKELRHRGEPLVEYPGADLWKAVGGSDGVTALIQDLYRRIEQDKVLRVAFPHFNSQDATSFFLQWFGGSRGYSDDLAGGLLRRHQHRYISPKAAAAWLRCMREALVARGLDPEQIMRPLARVAKAMIHSPETEPNELRKGCDAVQDAAQVRFETLLNDAAKGRTKNVREALAKDRTFASRRGMHNRTLAWVATYRNRPKLLELMLKAGADCNTPACDPMHATMACDHVQMGTGVAVTPLAIAKKWRPALVAPLVEHGAVDDVFTAAWLGDLPALRRHVERNPELVNAIDPADDFKEVSLLCHAVCGGNIDAMKLLLERGGEVNRHSGKLLTLAVLMNRVDLVKNLIEHGADVERTGFLGRLDDAERPVADLLIAHGKKVPAWMLPRACRPDVSSNELHRVTVLLDYGASLDDRGRYGLTALHYAVRGGKVPLIKLLLERGAQADALDESGLTPLLHLSKTRSKADPIPVMELLAASGANVDARDETQGTLLMYFARQGKTEPVRWLLAHGADRNARNKSGKTAAEIGRAHPGILPLLTK